jgi:flotillin
MLNNVPIWAFAGAAMIGGPLVVTAMLATMYRHTAPGEVLVVYGFRGTRIVTVGGTVIYPFFENYKRLSLELMSFEVAPGQSFHTSDRAVVAVDAAAQVKVRSNLESIQAAAQWFLSKTREQRQEMIRQMMESRMRTIIAHSETQQVVREPQKLADQMRLNCAPDISKMGLEMVSFRVKGVREQNDNG